MSRTNVNSPLEYIPNPLRATMHQLAMAKQADVSDPVRRHIYRDTTDALEMAVVYAVRGHVLDEIWDALD